MSGRQIGITLDELVSAFEQEEVFNTAQYLDAESGEVLTITGDLIDYCRGEKEGTDLQLSDSHELPAAQAIAEELIALENGFDERGLPYGPEDRRYFPVPRIGRQGEEAVRQAVVEWLQKWNLKAG